jgi:uncharacterized protein DUF4153
MSRSMRTAVWIAVASAALGVWADVLFRGQALGLNVFVWAVAFTLAGALLLRVSGAPLHQGRRWMVAPLIVFSAAFLWHDSALLAAANFLALAGAVVLGALRRTETAVRATPTDYAAGLVAAGFSAAAGSVHLLHKDIDWSHAHDAVRNERLSAVGRGVALGLPLLAIFGGLFIAADAVFKSLIVTAVPSIQDPLGHVLVVSAVAWLAAGLLRDLLASREDERLLSPAAVAAIRIPFSLGATELGVALGALNLLFLAFVLVQFRYLFGGRELVEARAHLTYAQYARHGFFELLAVSGLALIVLLAAEALARKGSKRGATLVRGLSAALIGLVFVVMASALQRMHVYVEAYGLSELRIYAVGVMLWLGVVLVWFAATLLRGRRDLFAVGAVLAGFAATGALNVIDPDALIVRTNLDRPRADLAYVVSLSDDAVPELLKRLPTLHPDQQRAVARALLRRSDDKGDWRSFNVARSRADALLARHRTELLQFSR